MFKLNWSFQCLWWELWWREAGIKGRRWLGSRTCGILCIESSVFRISGYTCTFTNPMTDWSETPCFLLGESITLRCSSSIINGPFVDDLDDLHFQLPLQSPFWPGIGLKVSRIACSPAEVATWTKQVGLCSGLICCGWNLNITHPGFHEHGNGKSPILVGDTSSDGRFSIVMLVFRGVECMILRFVILNMFQILGRLEVDRSSHPRILQDGHVFSWWRRYFVSWSGVSLMNVPSFFYMIYVTLCNMMQYYCWWLKKNPAPVDRQCIPLFFRVSYIPGGCLGFQPSTAMVFPGFSLAASGAGQKPQLLKLQWRVHRYHHTQLLINLRCGYEWEYEKSSKDHTYIILYMYISCIYI